MPGRNDVVPVSVSHHFATLDREKEHGNALGDGESEQQQ